MDLKEVLYKINDFDMYCLDDYRFKIYAQLKSMNFFTSTFHYRVSTVNESSISKNIE